MFRFALASLCIATATPAAFAGDQSLYPHVHTNTPIVGSHTSPINYRPHNAAGSNKSRPGFIEGEIVRSGAYSEESRKFIKRTKRGAGSDAGPVTEIYTENLPALNGGHVSRHHTVQLGSNLPRY